MRSYEIYSEQDEIQYQLLEKNSRYGPYKKEYIRADGQLIAIILNSIKIKETNGNYYIWSIVEDISSNSHYDIQRK